MKRLSSLIFKISPHTFLQHLGMYESSLKQYVQLSQSLRASNMVSQPLHGIEENQCNPTDSGSSAMVLSHIHPLEQETLTNSTSARSSRESTPTGD